MRKYLIPIASLLGFIFLLISSFLFNTNTFNPNDINVIFSPANYAFSIWGIIYILIGIFVLKGFLCKNDECTMYKKILKFFIPCMIFTGLTILVPIKVSPLFIIIALISSYLCYLTIDKSNVSKIFRLPFSFLMTWLLVATILDIQLVLKIFNKFNFTESQEINIVIGILLLLSITVMIFSIIKNDLGVILVTLWAIIAIGVNKFTLLPILILTSGLSLLLILFLIFNSIRIFLKKNKRY